ncbi:MAG: hypothetical protein HUJ69_00865 [Lachnospiraceae bacterium]|nr:hypothetical protein [Lachnospiraceae bacterium]
MKYVVSAMSIVNDLHYADGKELKQVTGGGLFMLGGVLSAAPEVGFVTSAGYDFEKYHADYFVRHGLSVRGVHRELPHTHYTTVTYNPDGGWKEVSIYGKEYEQQTAAATMVHWDWIAELCSPDTKAIYTESGVEEDFFQNPEEIRLLKEQFPRALLMWEVPHYNTFNDDQRPRILPQIQRVDLFSVNLREARCLFGAEDEAEVIRRIKATGKPCFLRMGTKGSCVVLPDRKPVFVPSVGVDSSVDPTGCGNTSTACSMVGFAEGYEPALIGALANVAAAYNAAQLGPWPCMDDAMRSRIMAEAKELAKKAVEL